MTFKLIKLPQTKNFACPQAKKKKDLFVLKQKDIFLFCFAVATNLIEKLKLHSFLVCRASSPVEGQFLLNLVHKTKLLSLFY